MKKQRPTVQNSKINDPALTHMREVAYGNGMDVFIHRVARKSEGMRDDQAMLDAAVAKRLRKANRSKS